MLARVPSLGFQEEKGRLINAIVSSENEALSSVANIDHVTGPKALSGKSEADLRLRMFESILDSKEESCGGFGTQC